jgi:hypothetical protein
MARKYRYTLGVGYAKQMDERIFDDEELDGMSDEEIEKYVNEDYEAWTSNFIDGGFERID